MKTLVVLLGPTGVGKTQLSFELAHALDSPIISADSRQIFRETIIGTAAPTNAELQLVQHYFIGSRSIFEPYSAGQYEIDALALINQLFQSHDYLLMVGGSMMYIDAVCKGFDEIPTVSDEVRQLVRSKYQEYGIDWLQQQLLMLDPQHFQTVDRNNHQRLMRAVEICMQTGQTYSSMRKGFKTNNRPFKIIKIGLNRPREILYERINTRVDQMLDAGLIDEAKQLYPHRQLNALNTVGYKELFSYFDGKYDLSEAVRLIKQDTRHFAKRQLTWFRADETIMWYDASNVSVDEIMQAI